MTWISLAIRNLFRNARRSITTVLAVALGYAAINILGGFAAYMFTSIEDAHIYEQINGHVQVWKKGSREYGGPDPAQFLISAEELAAFESFAESNEQVEFAAGMLETKGSIDYNNTVGFFVGQAMQPSKKEAIHSRSTALRSADGRRFEGDVIDDQSGYGIAITPGMRTNLEMDLGAELILMAPSYQGQMNAVDATVLQIEDVASEALDNRYIFMPLELAQTLYETDQVSSVRLLLTSNEATDLVIAEMAEQFPDSEWDIIPWYDVSKLYLRTRRMFNIIFGMVFAIIAVIATMSVLNTIGMAVVERTREIGTLRAIGLKRPGVVRLFGLESACLGILGATLGLIITLTFSGIVGALEPTWEPPVTAREIVWEIRVVPFYLVITFVLLVLFTGLAAIAPASRAAKQSIVDSLGHV